MYYIVFISLEVLDELINIKEKFEPDHIFQMLCFVFVIIYSES